MQVQATGVVEVFSVFLRLGCTSFGGPIAHLGYFEEEFVRRRRWLNESDYAQLVALCQFLPGPASSQVGFAIGLRRAGLAGAMAAWTGFTLPSALLMLAAAAGVGMASDGGWITGLKLVAVAVVAEALRSLGAKLAVGPARASLAAGSAVLVLLVPGVWSQLAAILLGAACGWLLLRAPETTRPPATRQTSGWPWLAALGALLLLLPWAAHSFPGSLAAFAAPYFQAGALVFGGGHVVLPLLEAVTVSQGHLGTEPFLAGYGLAQAVPGPLFTFTAYLGSLSNAGPGGVAGGFLALTATFLPSWLLVLGVHAYWEQVRSRPGAQAALAGANAAVVGLLLAALYDPVGTAVWGDVRFFAFTLVAFTLLRWARMPSWLLVGVGAGAGWMLF